MYDLSVELNDFYEQCVLLSSDCQQELREKRNLNLARLKSGLEEYNNEHNTSYKIVDFLTQGSMAMHTIVQNDDNDYDIDVAVIFDKSILGDLGPRATRNIVADALKRKCNQLKKNPEVKTNCVRIEYSSGYHVDFAIYRRIESDNGYVFEHAGSEWTLRNPQAINSWFSDEVSKWGNDLRKVIRLSKAFCKSRSFWVNMAAGLIQTVVCDEEFKYFTRLDETFYYTMVAVRDRLDKTIEVYNPTDSSISLLLTQDHRKKVDNWRNHLNEQLDNLTVLFKTGCTYAEAKNAWYRFFNHSFWQEDETYDKKTYISSRLKPYRDTEQFIEDNYIYNEQYGMTISCIISRDGFRPAPIKDFLLKCLGRLPHGFSIDCELIDTDAPSYDKVLWKVRNVGKIAEEKDMIRGQICDRGKKIHEHSDFYGPHYIECYLIKENKCIACWRIDVPIDDK